VPVNPNQHNIDIQKIIAEKRLDAFILGTEAFSFIPFLQDDYTRWNLLREYYHSQDNLSQDNRIIKETIINLFNYLDPKAKFASLDLSRLLELREIEAEIQKNIQKEEFNTLPLHIQEELLYVATKLRLSRVRIFVVETLVKRKKLKDFLLWNSTPLHVTHVIGQESIWCVETLDEYYTNTNKTKKSLIEEQMKPVAVKYPKIRAVFNTYLSNSLIDTPFHKMLRRILA